MTKGVIPDEFFELFQKYPKQVQAQIGLISTDKSVLFLFEPNAATPEIRLEQIRKLTEMGIQTRVRLDPIIPGVTDDEETMEQVCRSVAAAGVKSIAASVLFLRPAIKESLQRNIVDAEIQKRIFDRFSGSKRLGIHADRSSVTAISREDREAIFRRLHGIASRYGLSLHVCGCKNPDIPADVFSKDCRLSGTWNSKPQQKELFELE